MKRISEEPNLPPELPRLIQRLTDYLRPMARQVNAVSAVAEGVPAGGTTGQVLSKASGDDFDTQWSTPSGGGGGLSAGQAAVISLYS